MATEAETATARGDERKKGTPVSVVHPRPLPLPGIHVSMPTGVPGRVLWWGGLAALAALDVVDWPVAVLAGVGSWIAEQNAKAARDRAAERQRAS